MAVTAALLAYRFVIPVFGNVLTLVGNSILEFLVASAVFLTFLGIFLMMVLRRSIVRFGFILRISMYFRQWS
jgi:hypothetical protein